ncbi:MAG: hypothetical protein QS98_C0009G0009 [archaeon GW2011_AR3]|nr:MAG: hypothetical protein QS98_C0009G0009 [archaeon GW2011_AR3]MBS3110312.1 fused MFS/spermidine synthase [Candidatus Woesearchaeota archaeon]
MNRVQIINRIINFAQASYPYAVVFLAGAAVMILELLGTRIISPYYGTTLFVWSALITVTLVFLAIGYYLGGKAVDMPSLFGKMEYAIAISGLLFIVIPKISARILLLSNSLGNRMGPLSAAALLFGPAFVLLGMVVPYCVKSATKKLESVGNSSGKVYASSTIGSVVGTLAAGFYLIPNFRLSTVISCTGILLILISVLGMAVKKSYRVVALSLAAMVILMLVPSYSVAMKDGSEIVYSKDSIMGKIVVVDKGSERYLLVDGATQAGIFRDGEKSGKSILIYPDYMLLGISPGFKSALVIGLGGGVLSKELEEFGLDVESVEIDNEIAKVAMDYFGFEGTAVIQDGRAFLRNSQENYDMIILDVYSGYSVPHYMLSRESFEEAKARLSPGGVLVVNTLGYLDSGLQQSVYATLVSVFSDVKILHDDPSDLMNIVFFVSDGAVNFYPENVCVRKGCSEQEEEMLQIYLKRQRQSLAGGTLLTDDYSPVDLLQARSQDEWRRINLNFYGEGVLLSG